MCLLRSLTRMFCLHIFLRINKRKITVETLFTWEQLCWRKILVYRQERWREWFFGGIKFPPATTTHYQHQTSTYMHIFNAKTLIHTKLYIRIHFLSKLIFLPCDLRITKIVRLKIVLVWLEPLATINGLPALWKTSKNILTLENR